MRGLGGRRALAGAGGSGTDGGVASIEDLMGMLGSPLLPEKESCGVLG